VKDSYSFFSLQALDVLGNNLCKQGFLLALAYYQFDQTHNSTLMANAMVTLYIIPFFLLSFAMGVFAENRSKVKLMRAVKGFDCIVIAAIVYSYYLEWPYLTLILIACLGAKTAMITPLKYAYMAETFQGNELVRANSLIQGLSLSCILLAMILSGLLMEQTDSTVHYSLILLAISVTGLVLSFSISNRPVNDNPPPSRDEPHPEIKSIRATIERAGVLRFHLVAIAWFWFLSASYMTQLINYLKLLIGGNPATTSVAFSIFIAGMFIGALLAEKTRFSVLRSTRYSGLILGGMCLMLASLNNQPIVADTAFSSLVFQSPALACILFVTGIFATWYVTPLYSSIQARAARNTVSKLMGVSGILNACFIVTSTALAFLAFGIFSMELPVYFAALGILNTAIVLLLVHWGKQREQELIHSGPV